MGRPRKYFTEEERKAANRAHQAKWYQCHKDEKTEYLAGYYKQNRDEILAQQYEYRSTPYGRANYLLYTYKQNDKKYNRGECTLTEDWIVENVFSGQCCHYCGETDWMKLGVDRKDSSLPHTPENCVPCCKRCNKIKGTTPYDEFMRMIGKIKSGGSPTS